jgi:hypothetical protein
MHVAWRIQPTPQIPDHCIVTRTRSTKKYQKLDTNFVRMVCFGFKDFYLGVGMLYVYPAVSVTVSSKLLSRPPPKTSPLSQCELPHVQASNQRRCLPPHGEQPGSYCLSSTTHALASFNLASKNKTLSY